MTCGLRANAMVPVRCSVGGQQVPWSYFATVYGKTNVAPLNGAGYGAWTTAYGPALEKTTDDHKCASSARLCCLLSLDGLCDGGCACCTSPREEVPHLLFIPLLGT